MKIVEVHILLCIVSSSVAVLLSKPCQNNVVTVRHAVDISNVRDTCLCPQPNDGYQVADLLNKQKTDLERVVVFLYRDKTNDEVYMYTPSGDKQVVIPELTYDAEDDFEKIDNQVSLRLFDSPANALLQTYQYPNNNRHRYQHLNHRLTHLPKGDSYLPYAWYYQHTNFNRFRPDEPKSNVEAINGDDLSPYMQYSPSDNIKWPIRNKKFNYLNKQVFGNNVNYAQAPLIHSSQSFTSNTNSYDFDKWYTQNVIQFPEIYYGDAKYITFNDLREHLLRIFNEHGYSVINNQVLDPQGEAVDSSHYKLIRVKIKQENDENLSTEVEGIMFIKLYPLTILGVVPLTNNIKIENKEIFDEQVFRKEDLKAEAKIDVGTTSASETKEAVTTETPKTSSTTKPKPFEDLFKNLFGVVNRLVPSHRESDIDPPGYRIIGGSAATGSGAPISSKGRSGTPQ